MESRELLRARSAVILDRLEKRKAELKRQDVIAREKARREAEEAEAAAAAAKAASAAEENAQDVPEAKAAATTPKPDLADTVSGTAETAGPPAASPHDGAAEAAPVAEPPEVGQATIETEGTTAPDGYGPETPEPSAGSSRDPVSAADAQGCGSGRSREW